MDAASIILLATKMTELTLVVSQMIADRQFVQSDRATPEVIDKALTDLIAANEALTQQVMENLRRAAGQLDPS